MFLNRKNLINNYYKSLLFIFLLVIFSFIIKITPALAGDKTIGQACNDPGIFTDDCKSGVNCSESNIPDVANAGKFLFFCACKTGTGCEDKYGGAGPAYQWTCSGAGGDKSAYGMPFCAQEQKGGGGSLYNKQYAVYNVNYNADTGESYGSCNCKKNSVTQNLTTVNNNNISCDIGSAYFFVGQQNYNVKPKNQGDCDKVSSSGGYASCEYINSQSSAPTSYEVKGQINCSGKIYLKSDKGCSVSNDCCAEGDGVCSQNFCYYTGIEPGKFPVCSKSSVPVPIPFVSDVQVDLSIKKPIINIKIPGLNFSDLSSSTVTEEDGKTFLNIPYLGEYIAAIYKVSLVVISIIAVAMIIVAGLKIIVGGNEGKVEGFRKIGQILIGLFIGWGSYTILSVVNPDLVNFKALKVQYVEKVALPDPEDSGGDFPATGNPTRLCDTVESCKPYCLDKSKWDTMAATTGMIAESQTIDLSTVNMPGVKVQKGARASNYLIEPLKKAGVLADQAGYQLYISSGFRSLAGQLAKACPSILEGKKSSSVSWPGGSNHGSGRAVDIYLQNKNGKTLSSPATAATQNNEEYKQYNKKLAEIMYAAGWKRLKIEVWHFEFPGSEVEASRTTNCFETSC